MPIIIRLINGINEIKAPDSDPIDAVLVFLINNNEIIIVIIDISYAIAVNEPTPGATPFPPLNFKNIGQQCPSIMAIAVVEIIIGIDSLFKKRILVDNLK